MNYCKDGGKLTHIHKMVLQVLVWQLSHGVLQSHDFFVFCKKRVFLSMCIWQWIYYSALFGFIEILHPISYHRVFLLAFCTWTRLSSFWHMCFLSNVFMLETVKCSPCHVMAKLSQHHGWAVSEPCEWGDAVLAHVQAPEASFITRWDTRLHFPLTRLHCMSAFLFLKRWIPSKREDLEIYNTGLITC